MALYKKYRPPSFDKVYGNEEVVEALSNKVKNNDVPQVILFHGPTGCGKTTLARILAKELNCGDNIVELDSAQFTGIDTIREIRKKSRYKPIGGKNKAYIMDEVHMLSSAAQNGFLKGLEETPKHVYYFLCTTNPEKLIEPLRGRCSIQQLSLLDDTEMKSLLKYVVKKEKKDVDKKVYKVIIKNSGGHPRNALNILDDVISVSKKKQLKIAEKFEQETNESIELARAMINRKGWNEAQRILKGLKQSDAEGIRRHILAYCTSVLLGKDYRGSHQMAAIILEEFSEPTYNSGFAQIMLACYSVFFSDTDD